MQKRLMRLCALLTAAVLWLCAPSAMALSQKTQGAHATVDFALVQALYPEVVGWLYQAETEYSQPLMQGPNNTFYQSHVFDGANLSSARGSVYLDSAADPSFAAPLSTLYGDGRTGGPLESLAQYQQRAYYAAHPTLRLLTPQGDYDIAFFACVKGSTRNQTNWRPTQDDALAGWCAARYQDSLYPMLRSALPAEGERVVLFEITLLSKTRLLLYGTLRPAAYDTPQTYDLAKLELDSADSLSGQVMVGSLGKRTAYFQNDPLWERMRYESSPTSRYRLFGGGGCGPTAVATALANVLPAERLPVMASASLSEHGILFCACSVNRYFCNHKHTPYQLSTPEEYLRYLPVAVANYAAGNNQAGVNSRETSSYGTSMSFLESLSQLLGLEYTYTRLMEDALAALRAAPGRTAVVACATKGSPFTLTSHYVTLVGVDSTYLYILDPLRRGGSEYQKMDKRGVTQVLSPGVLRVRLEDAELLLLSPLHILTDPDAAQAR